jgi:hypothetical protein
MKNPSPEELFPHIKERVCKKCESVLPASNFSTFFHQKSGCYYLAGMCKGCAVKKAQEYARANKERVAENYKAHRKRSAEELRDWYIINQLKTRNGYTNEQIAELGKELLEAKRTLLKIHRKIKKINDAEK